MKNKMKKPDSIYNIVIGVLIVGIIGAISAMWMVFFPDENPKWPGLRTFIALLCSVLVLVGYAYALRPLGFIIPTALAAGILSYQISPNFKHAIAAGTGLSITLFLIFKYLLDLGLVAFPKWLLG